MTIEEERWQEDVRRIGCCVCVRTGLGDTPAAIHHMLSKGKRRRGELYTLGLCYTHHQSDVNNRIATSRHPWKRAFEERYGAELELLEWTRQQVQRLRACAVC